MIPLFKSHYSIGRSILTLAPPKTSLEKSSDSIFDIVLDNSIKKLVLVEDSPGGFLAARSICSEYNIDLCFGLRFNLSCDPTLDDSFHKVIIFALNDSGCKRLNLIFSEIESNKSIDSFKVLASHWHNEDLLLAVPFYDSFLFQNSFRFSICAPNFSFCNPVFFLESNGLPFDTPLRNIVVDFCSQNSFETYESKSIFYKNRCDLEAFQTYKCICDRKFSSKRSLSNPMLEHFGSNNFCFESWLESNNTDE